LAECSIPGWVGGWGERAGAGSGVEEEEEEEEEEERTVRFLKKARHEAQGGRW
jgi:hypothetical protein